MPCSLPISPCLILDSIRLHFSLSASNCAFALICTSWPIISGPSFEMLTSYGSDETAIEEEFLQIMRSDSFRNSFPMIF